MFAIKTYTMEKITKKIVDKLITQAISKGKSEPIEVSDKDVGYFRVLLSSYNKFNKTKLSLRGLNGVYKEVYAPFDHEPEHHIPAPVNALLKQVVSDSSFSLTEDEYLLVNECLVDLNEKCKRRVNYILGREVGHNSENKPLKITNTILS
jgi:hypothetical protein